MNPSLFLVLVALYSVPALAMPLTVVIDPGHGGKDHGALHGNFKESDITLQVADRLQRLLIADTRFKVRLTRSSDEFLSLSQRTERAQSLGAEVLLSIHVNSSHDRRAQGLEVYFQNQLPPDEESMFLAARENQNEVQRSPAAVKSDVSLIVQDLERNHRIFQSSRLARNIKKSWLGHLKSDRASIQQAPFFVISNINAPSALVEIGFLSHPTEGPLLVSENYQNTIAQSLYRGLARYQETLDKPSR
jgi:N-acetylmuramoyl-L-alanine amidase